MLSAKQGFKDKDASTVLKEISSYVKGDRSWSWEKYKSIFDEDLTSKNSKWKKKLETKDSDTIKTGFKMTVHQRPGDQP